MFCSLDFAGGIESLGLPVIRTAPSAFSGGTSPRHSLHLHCTESTGCCIPFEELSRLSLLSGTASWLLTSSPLVSVFSELFPCLAPLFNNVSLILSRRSQSWSDWSFLNYNCLAVLTETSRSCIPLVSVLTPCLTWDGLSAQWLTESAILKTWS